MNEEETGLYETIKTSLLAFLDSFFWQKVRQCLVDLGPFRHVKKVVQQKTKGFSMPA